MFAADLAIGQAAEHLRAMAWTLNTAGDLQGGIEEAEHLLGRLVRTEGPAG